MKLLDITIRGFGRFYQRSFSFQDGLHVLYGPNEAGKSTLHTFIGCMLFGLERGRGRAARGDLYSRYLPWDHDASYGGSLSFESNDELCRIERSFRADSRSCIFTAPGQSPVLCRDNELPQSYYEGLTESLYWNTISVRQLGSAADASLAEELGRRLAGMQQTGSDTISYPAAAAWLKAERKRQEALLDPTLESRTLRLKQEAVSLAGQLNDSSYQEKKAHLERQTEDCMEQLAQLAAVTGPSGKSSPDSHGLSSSAGRGFPGLLFTLLLLLLAGFLRQAGQDMAAGIVGVMALTAGLITVLTRRHRYRRYDSAADEADTGTGAEDKEGSDTGAGNEDDAKRLRNRLRTLQKQYQEVCRQEWEHDRLLERAQAIEEELEVLADKNAKEENIRLEIQAINLALTTLKQLSEQMRDSLGPHLNDSMSRILSGLTGGVYTEVYVDSQLNVSVHTGIRTVPLESLSRGTIEQIHLSMRLAVIDLLFPQGGMPLLLDDCFLSYDDERLTQTLSWLAENYSGQVFLFTCQKREAALLQQEQIPFTYMEMNS